jgi:hypothetical protein
VRRTDADTVSAILDGIVARTCIGLPPAATGIDEETATTLTADCTTLEESISLLQNPDYLRQWQDCLGQLAYGTQTAPVLRGFAVRRLMDHRLLEGEALYGVLARSTSPALPPIEAASWLEGFLKGPGTILLLDENLWRLVDDFIDGLGEEAFTQILPLLRRSFADFSPAERRKMGEKAAGGAGGPKAIAAGNMPFNKERAAAGIPVILRLLGHKTIPV